MKFKVLTEFDRFYLAQSPSGYKETFSKTEYKPDSEGYIVTKEIEQKTSTGHPPKNTPWKKESKRYGNVEIKEIWFEEFMDNE